jgi:hypothetical protein
MDARMEGILNYLNLFSAEDLARYGRQLGLNGSRNVVDQIADLLYRQGYEVAVVKNDLGKLNRWSNQYGSGYVPDALDARGDGHSLIGANNRRTNSVSQPLIKSPRGSTMALGSWVDRASVNGQSNVNFKLPEVFDQTGYNRWANQYGSGYVHDALDKRGENVRSLSNLMPFRTQQGQQVLSDLARSGSLNGSGSLARSGSLNGSGSLARSGSLNGYRTISDPFSINSNSIRAVNNSIRAAGLRQ